MENYHGIRISRSTLLNKVKEYGLKRRNNKVNQNHVRQCILEELDGSGRLLYRAMWRRLQSKHGVLVPSEYCLRNRSEGSRLRKANQLHRGSYLNPGPKHCWHADGYDKLKLYGFPIHSCIDGYSRQIM